MYSKCLMVRNHVFRINNAFNKLAFYGSTRNVANDAVNYKENFVSRHVGINQKAEADMLKTLNLKSLDDLVAKTVPSQIYFNKELNLSSPMS
jgi:glycine dehydrogenase